MKSAFFVLTVVATHVVHGQMGTGKVTNEDGQGSIKFGPPDLSDEESQAHYMPRHLRCDACHGIAVKFSNLLRTATEKNAAVRAGKKRLGDEQVIEMFETSCADEWNNFGLKEVNGVKRLSYPGSPIEKEPGVQQGGGIWPRRMHDMCFYLVGEFDEERIYEAYRKNATKGVKKLMCSKICGDGKKNKKQKTEL